MLWVILMEMKVSQVSCFQITGSWLCYSNFFDISFIVFFMRLLSKSLWIYEETILFQLKFQKPISRCSILQKIRMFNTAILKWRPFEYRVKSWKAELESRTWKQNWKQAFDCKLVYILGKTVQDMVLDSYLRQIASGQVTFWCF